jgi:uncharacterized membrane protein YdjX (TVP38/TMEM64 family)
VAVSPLSIRARRGGREAVAATRAEPPADDDPVAAAGGGRRWLWVGLGLFAACLLAAWLLLPIAAWVEGLRHWLVGLGPAGAALFILFYVAATVVLAPDWPISVLAGVVYGAWGFPIVLVALLTASSLAFLVARHLARGRLRRALVRRPRLAAVDEAVSDEGWKIVFLLRLSPLVPFNLQNYVFGVTEIPYSQYAVATIVGMSPATALYIYIGALGHAAHRGAGRLTWLMFALGLAATIAVAALIARKARQKLARVGLKDGPEA